MICLDIKFRKFLAFLVITILYAAMIFALSSSSDPPGAEEGKQAVPYFSHLAHTALYFGFAFCVFETLKHYPKELDKNIYLLAFAITVIYGVTDEIHQYFVPYRHFTLIDIFFNSVGAGLLVSTMYLIENKSFLSSAA